MNKLLLEKLKSEAKKILDNNTRFHDYLHADEVLNNVISLLKVERSDKYDKDVLFAASLFHDGSNRQDTELEGIEGADTAEKILQKIKEFPKEKIKEVKRLIKAHTKYGRKKEDEILFEAADQMAAFSDLGLIRSFMMYGKAGIKIKESINGELDYLNKRFNSFRLPSAKRMVKNNYLRKKAMLEKILNY